MSQNGFDISYYQDLEGDINEQHKIQKKINKLLKIIKQ